MRFSFAVLAAAAIATIAQALPAIDVVESTKLVKRAPNDACNYDTLEIRASGTYECLKCRVKNNDNTAKKMLEFDNKHAMYICEIIAPKACFRIYSFTYCRA
ncbi:hypothetical protein BGZ65_000689 [Modicella reniformis]|uniref:Uncharacterized protein n=1 Tax=Modicella reniformis TaxID=1440133 RepID=A0A9P6MA98_9FUNG|nr:hypothetical protein BGZ65_000689 [Modicella reniformis]